MYMCVSRYNVFYDTLFCYTGLTTWPDTLLDYITFEVLRFIFRCSVFSVLHLNVIVNVYVSMKYLLKLIIN